MIERYTHNQGTIFCPKFMKNILEDQERRTSPESTTNQATQTLCARLRARRWLGIDRYKMVLVYKQERQCKPARTPAKGPF